MNKIKAILVEDEQVGMDNLVFKINKHCPNIEIIGKALTGESAIEMIKDNVPDLVFLDIELGTMSGFDVLDRLRNIRFEVIFTTAYSEYATRAFKENALHYIVKPIESNELINGVERAIKKISKLNDRIPVPVRGGFKLIPVKNIIYCLADDNLTKIFIQDLKPITITRTLKKTMEQLSRYPNFMRIHRSSAVNIDQIDSYKTADGGFVIMKNSDELSVSRDYKKDLLRRLGAG